MSWWMDKKYRQVSLMVAALLTFFLEFHHIHYGHIKHT